MKLVPFKLERNRVIVPTSANGSEPLNLILDTGMGFDGVYLFHKEFIDLMDTSGAIEVHVPGSGSGEAATLEIRRFLNGRNNEMPMCTNRNSTPMRVSVSAQRENKFFK